MAGAIYYHLVFGVPSPIPAFVLAALLFATIWVFRRRGIDIDAD